MESDLPASIGKVAARELRLNGFATLASLTAASERELLAIHGVGPKAIRLLRAELAQRGLDLHD